jgi:acetolactate synthase-1/2/3 large subunit
MATDLVAEDEYSFCGRPGILGQRAANIIQQKAGVIFSYGARLDGEQVAYNYDGFAPYAHNIIYDMDFEELRKLPNTARWRKEQIDLSVPGPGVDTPEYTDPRWLAWCKDLYTRFRLELEGPATCGKHVDPFAFMRVLSDALRSDDMIALGSSGAAPCSFFQAFKVKAGQRISNVSTIGAMGADIPMAIGAAIASGRRTICVTGDGGFMLNSQELETARRLALPITFFVFNNGGYGSIRSMQDNRFDGRRVGCDVKSGLTLPGLEDLAYAYRINYSRMTGADLDSLPGLLGGLPRIVEVMVDPAWAQYPRVMASMQGGEYRIDAMQDMTPKLDPDELKAIMEWDG